MIGFAVPWVLAALPLAAVPIILHLFARRDPPTVTFPAVRYLTDTARNRQRRLTLQHLLLLLARTLLILLLVLAAAGPSLPGRQGAAHAPASLVLVVDNSLSSGATLDGVPVFDQLREAAHAVLDRASNQDALWLLPADGLPRRGDPGALRAILDSLRPSARRLDLSEAVARARDVLATSPLAGEVLMVTDLQATALGGAAGEGVVTVARPDGPTPGNAGLASIEAGAQPWTVARTPVLIGVTGTLGSVPFSVSLDGRPVRQGVATAEGPVAVTVTAGPAGWRTLVVELAPDELRGDDRWEMAVRVAPPAVVTWDGSDRFTAAAASVLLEGGRIREGAGVQLGGTGPGASVVVPPEDPARLGAVNRWLADRGVPWRYGSRVSGASTTDSAGLLPAPVRVALRHVLEPTGGAEQGVLITIDNAPWLIRHQDVVVAGSRFDTTWTDLPVTAGFVPLLDALLNRVVRGDLAVMVAAPGDAVRLPDQVDAVTTDSRALPVEGGGSFHPGEPGLHFLVSGRDTVGIISVNPDPRESLLARAGDREVRDIWPGARIVDLDEAGAAAFTVGARADLRGSLLVVVLLLGLTEAALAGWRRRSR